MKAFNLLKLASKAITLELNQGNSDLTINYNTEANSYNAYSKYFEESVEEMVEKLPIKKGQYLLYIGSDIGEFIHRLARKVGEQGKVFAVNLSSGMLQDNQENVQCQGLSNISYVQSDIFSFLYEMSNNSVDGVVCAWSICYLEHSKLLQEVQRVLKTAGFTGLIEDKANSLKDIYSILLKVLIDYPSALNKKLKFNLPKDKNYLVKNLRKHSFYVQDAWEREVIIPCNSGTEIADYILQSADIGFLEALDKKLFPQFLQTFISYADQRFARGWERPVLHKFCAIVGIKA